MTDMSPWNPSPERKARAAVCAWIESDENITDNTTLGSPRIGNRGLHQAILVTSAFAIKSDIES